MRLNARVSTDTHIGSVLLPAMAVIALISIGAQKCYYSVLATRQSSPFVRTLTMRRQFFLFRLIFAANSSLNMSAY